MGTRYLHYLFIWLVSERKGTGEETTPRTKYLQWGLAIFTIFLSG